MDGQQRTRSSSVGILFRDFCAQEPRKCLAADCPRELRFAGAHSVTAGPQLCVCALGLCEVVWVQARTRWAGLLEGFDQGEHQVLSFPLRKRVFSERREQTGSGARPPAQKAAAASGSRGAKLGVLDPGGGRGGKSGEVWGCSEERVSQ